MVDKAENQKQKKKSWLLFLIMCSVAYRSGKVGLCEYTPDLIRRFERAMMLAAGRQGPCHKLWIFTKSQFSSPQPTAQSSTFRM